MRTLRILSDGRLQVTCNTQSGYSFSNAYSQRLSSALRTAFAFNCSYRPWSLTARCMASDISSGVRAPTTIPGKINSAHCPIALVFVGPGEPERVSDFSLHFRTFYVRCYVKPIAQDVKPDAGYSQAYMMLQDFIEEYLSDITFGGAVEHAGTGARYAPPTMEDSGIVVLEYAGTQYHGFEITIVTKEQIT